MSVSPIANPPEEIEEESTRAPTTPRMNPLWDHTITTVLGFNNRTDFGKAIRFWVRYHKLETLDDLCIYDPSWLLPDGRLEKYVEAEGQPPKTLHITPLHLIFQLRIYLEHLDSQTPKDIESNMDDHPFSLKNWKGQDKQTLINFIKRNPNRASSIKVSPNQYLQNFKKGIKREITSYPTLHDERKFDNFSRSFIITAKSHECEEVLDPTYVPSTEEQKQFFQAKQTFMYAVMNTHLLTDMGKTKVRKYYTTSDAQQVWKELLEHMKTSSKGASEKRRLTQYVTNTVLDNDFKGTTEQFVLHFLEQFRQLDILSDKTDQFSPAV